MSISDLTIEQIFSAIIVVSVAVTFFNKCWDMVSTKLKSYHSSASNKEKKDGMIDTNTEQIKEINTTLVKVNETLSSLTKKVESMEKSQNEAELTKLQTTLINAYNHYVPLKEWNEMESENFWRTFHEYELRGGDGYMHSVVEPAMRQLKVNNF